jgi:hypothetical protein
MGSFERDSAHFVRDFEYFSYLSWDFIRPANFSILQICQDFGILWRFFGNFVGLYEDFCCNAPHGVTVSK